MALEAEKYLAEEAKVRQVASRAQPGEKVGAKAVVNLPPPSKARDEAAALVGVSGKLV